MFESRQYWSTPKIVNKVIDILQHKGLLIAPSDTVLGLFAEINRVGFERLNKVKNRQNKPYLILIEKFLDLNRFVDLDNKPQIKELLQKVWPGPITVILPAKQGVESFLLSSSGSIAMRLPVHDALHQVMQKTGPLFSTSANKAGEPIPQGYKELNHELVAQADLVLCDEQKDNKEVQSSTIVDCTQDKPVVVRRGTNVENVARIIDQLWKY